MKKIFLIYFPELKDSDTYNVILDLIRSNFISKMITDNIILISTDLELDVIYKKIIETYTVGVLMVVPFSTFKGRLSSSIWEWLENQDSIKVKWDKDEPKP